MQNNKYTPNFILVICVEIAVLVNNELDKTIITYIESKHKAIMHIALMHFARFLDQSRCKYTAVCKYGI